MHLIPLLLALLLSAAAFGQGGAARGAAKAAPKTTARPAPKVAPKAAATPTPAAPAPAAAPEAFAITVSGSITDAEGLPLPGAAVWHPGTHEVLAIANAQGDFTLQLPTNAAVTLSCGYAGFGDQLIRLSRPHRNNDLVISLEPVARPKRR